MSKRSLLIGLGKIGMEYDWDLSSDYAIYTHARALQAHPFFELAGAVDPSEEKRTRFTERYQRPAFADLSEALDHLNPQVIVIAAPTEHHFDLIKQIISQYTSEVILCEKPLAYDLEEARQMVTLCAKNNIKLFVNYIRCSDPGAIEIKQRIDNGSVEVPVKGIVWYSKGFFHNGSHFFNLLEFWLGRYQRTTLIAEGRLWEEKDPEPDVYVEFEKGTITFLAAWEEAFSHYTVEILHKLGRFRYEKGGEYIAWQTTMPDPNFSGYTILSHTPEVIPNQINFYQLNVLEQLALSLSGKPAYLCNGTMALYTLEAMHEIINLKQKS